MRHVRARRSGPAIAPADGAPRARGPGRAALCAADPRAAPGAVPVARLLDLGATERRVILYLRLWCAGRQGQADVWLDLRARLGPGRAAPALAAFEALLVTCASTALCPLFRRPLACGCASRDEWRFGGLVALSGAGRRAEARALASLIAGAAGAGALARAAAAAAPGLAAGDVPRRAGLRAPAAPRFPSHPSTARPQ